MKNENINIEKFEELKAKKALKKANSREKKKVNNLVEELVIDKESGEVVKNTTTTQITHSKTAEPPFVKLYLDDLVLLNNLPTKSSELLWELMKGLTYENEIILNPYKKKQIMETLDIKLSTLNNALTSFVKKEILFRVGTGTFAPNPYLFARGTWDDIYDLRMIVTYQAGERKMKLEINGEPIEEYNENLSEPLERKIK